MNGSARQAFMVKFRLLSIQFTSKVFEAHRKMRLRCACSDQRFFQGLGQWSVHVSHWNPDLRYGVCVRRAVRKRLISARNPPPPSEAYADPAATENLGCHLFWNAIQTTVDIASSGPHSRGCSNAPGGSHDTEEGFRFAQAGSSYSKEAQFYETPQNEAGCETRSVVTGRAGRAYRERVF